MVIVGCLHSVSCPALFIHFILPVYSSGTCRIKLIVPYFTVVNKLHHSAQVLETCHLLLAMVVCRTVSGHSCHLM